MKAFILVNKLYGLYILFLIIIVALLTSCEKITEVESKNLSDIKIIQPSESKVFNIPGTLNIEWEVNGKAEKYELYYSKFNLGKESNWHLISDNINGNKTEYAWSLPSIYTNEVKLKIIGICSDSCEVVSISDVVFAIYDKNILLEEQQYQPKFGIGNKWVYHIIKDYVSGNDEDYLITKEVVNTKIDDGIKYYNVVQRVIKDSTTISNSWVTDRGNYSPASIMQNNDCFSTDDYNYWKCYSEPREEVFTVEQKIKKYRWGDAYSNGFSKTAKDIGVYDYYNMSEGFLTKKELKGAYIDGNLYGDTTIVN
jgi:hypothetical protein